MGLVDAEDDGQLIAFMRIGNESVPATPSQLRELVLRGSGESYYSLKSRYDFDNMFFLIMQHMQTKRKFKVIPKMIPKMILKVIPKMILKKKSSK